MKREKTLFFMLILLLTVFTALPVCASSQNFSELLPSADSSLTPSADSIVSPASKEDKKTEEPEGIKGVWMFCRNFLRYQYIDGNYLYNTWATIEQAKYHFDENGSKQVGWIQDETFRYYLNEDGVAQTGWVQIDENWYYLDANSAMVTGWMEDNGNNYYLNEEGIRQVGWTTISDITYYFDGNGVQTTGWVNDGNGVYYLQPDSSKTVGWLELDGKKYYFDGDGTMHTGWLFKDGRIYYLRDTGEYDSSKTDKTASGQMIALTFDDGPGQYTDRLLSILEANNAKATFFTLGSLVENYPDTLKKMDKLGCEIGSHTYSHTSLTTLDAAKIKEEMDKTNAAISKIVGHNPTVMRPPYGAYNDTVLKNVGLPSIMWSIDTLDWQTLNAENTVATVMDSVQGGDIILMHDIHSTSVDAAEILIPALIEKGYKLVTVSELAAAKGQKLEAGKSYNSFK